MRRILLVVPLILVVGVVAGAQSPSWLGLSISDGADTGVRVEDVVNDSPAAEGGMEVGDLIVEFDGRRCRRRPSIYADRTRDSGGTDGFGEGGTR